MSLVLAGAMVLSMTACAGNTAETTSAAAKTQETAADTASKAEETTGAEASESETAAKAEGTTYKIGVLQLVQHTALDAANDGFIAALDDAGIAYEVDQQNASGDQSAARQWRPSLQMRKRGFDSGHRHRLPGHGGRSGIPLS